MAKAVSVASWNVEHFKDDLERVDRVVKFLAEQNPDVLALYEVEGKEVFSAVSKSLPGYTFHISEGPQTQEILVGIRGNLSAFFTQKVEFKSGNSMLRPGALLTLTVKGQRYSMLFLHTKSSNKPIGLGIRDDMFERALKFKAVLDKAGGGKPANYLFLGDLNTMGMKYPYKRDIAAVLELRHLDGRAGKRGMRRLAKSAAATWSNGSSSTIPPSDLDHVIVSDHLKLKGFGTTSDGERIEVEVRGWAGLGTDAQKDKWIERYSDHSLLYFEVLD